MITFKEVDKSFLELYDNVSMNVNVHSEYKVKRINNGLGGFVFEEISVEPYIKDLSIYERATEYEKEFDITNWRFYMAFDEDIPVGAMTVVGKTDGLNMLYGREDACVLWDIRVADAYKYKGIGQEVLSDIEIENRTNVIDVGKYNISDENLKKVYRNVYNLKKVQRLTLLNG